MLDRIEMFLDCNEVLKRKIKIFKEYFIKYYGEERREEIERQFSKAIYIGYMTPQCRRNALNKFIKEESSLLQDVVVKKTNLPFTKKDLFDTYAFDSLNLLPIYHLEKLKREHDKGKKERLREFNEEGYEFTKRFVKDLSKIKYLLLKSVDQLPRKFPDVIQDNIEYYLDKSNAEHEYQRLYKKVLPLLQKINPNVTIDNLDEIFNNKDIDILLESYREALQQYELFRQEHKNVFRSDEKTEELKGLLSEKFYIMYVRDNIDLIPESERQPLYDYLDGKTKSFYHNKYFSEILGYNLQSTSILEYFSEENDLALTDPNNKWKADSIKRNRVEYFKLLGIDLGEDYEAYVNASECQKIWPSKQIVQRVIDTKNKYLNKYNNELFLGIDEYREIREKIDSLGLLDKEDSFNAALLTDSGTFVNPNIRMTDEGYDTFSLFVISFNNLNDDALDHHIVHELNHLFELMLNKVNGKEYEMLVGWDYAGGQIDNERKEEVETVNIDKKKRKYELFNEIINELIAQGICELMHNDGVTVFDEPGNSRYKRTTSYEDYLVLVKDFFAEFKEPILESRRNGNIEVIFNEVGKENFDELNSLIIEFYEHFKEMKIYKLLSALKKNEDNEMTRIYYDLLDRRDKVLENMRNYKQEHKTL